MSRYIDAVAEYIIPVVPADEKGKNLKFDFMNAKRLIRCKDCKNNPKRMWAGCPLAGCMSRTDEWYCPVGKPKNAND